MKAGELGILRFESSADITEVYLGLLIGDLQIRRVTGSMDMPARAFLEARAMAAREQVFRLFAAEGQAANLMPA